MVAAGQVPAVRVSGKWLLPRDLVDRWLAAHLASCRVEPAEVRRQAAGPAYLVDVLDREQGLISDRARTGKLADLAQASRRRLRFAVRQPASGTAGLVDRLVAEVGLSPRWTEVGPFSSHLALALAIRAGQADVGVGIHGAAQQTGLAFAPLVRERFALAVPAPFFAHARLAPIGAPS